MLYADKEKIQTLIDKQQTNLADIEYLDLDSVANLLNSFDNPKLPARNPVQSVTEAIREDSRIRQDNSQVRQPMQGTTESIRETCDSVAASLGVDVNYVTRDEMPRDSNGVQQRDAKGYQRGGRIYVCLENHSSEEDAAMTVMHEAVGHKGLRALVGPQNIIVEIERDGKNFVVGLHLNQRRQGIEVNSIRGIFPKENAEWLKVELGHAGETAVRRQRENPNRDRQTANESR